MKVAILGGGISGLTTAWQLAQLGQTDVTLFEASPRLGGIIDTVRHEGFVVEGGPDGWVSEKPWARDLAVELGLGDQLIGSLDSGRVTWIVQNGQLVAMPDAMRMMVPTDVGALTGSPLFSAPAIAAYRAEAGRADELRAQAPTHDESIADFVRRHFGEEVLTKIAAPLLSGVFGGDVTRLSVRAVMPRFVEMERQYGALTLALEGKGTPPSGSVFTSLAGGLGTLVDAIAAAIPPNWLRLNTTVSSLKRDAGANQWRVTTLGQGSPDTRHFFDCVFVAVPAPVAQSLLKPIDPRFAELLTLETSSAALAALAFDEDFPLPRGFGFLVPEAESTSLLAGTFVDQKFPQRVPGGKRLLRGFFGGQIGIEIAKSSDEAIATRTLAELRTLLEPITGPIPDPVFSLVRRWPRSLPQYPVGHLENMAELASLVAQQPNLTLLGNAYRGVGIPDLVRDARQAARRLA
jgi:oxygen-dependent protoporphyrinogen oxidase